MADKQAVTGISTSLVVGDIGGTNSRLAVVGDDGETGVVEVVRNDTAGSVEDLLQRFMASRGLRPRHTRIRLAVACPVSGDRIRFTNRDWAFSVAVLRRALAVAGLCVVNDFTAMALALPHFGEADLIAIGGGSPRSDAPKVVLGSGTGLGVAASIPIAGAWYPIPGEGGHASLAPLSDDDARILGYARARHGHVSAERLLTGPGLRLLYEAESALDGGCDGAPSPEHITRLAASGRDALAVRTMARFFALLGGFAGNLALSFGARGGVYLAGGILPQTRELLGCSAFREAFEAKGRFRAYLADIATRLVVHPQPALLGLSRAIPAGVAVAAE